MTPTLLTLVLAWGVLTFGAVYPWGFGPLAAAILAIAVWQWRPRAPRLAGWAALLVIAAVSLQVVPLGTTILEGLSPAAARLLASLDVAYANGIRQTHPLSINPAATLLALGALVLAAIWVPTCASILRRPGVARTLARNLVVLGTVLAIIGFAQNATFNGKVLWLWTPEFRATNSFGPFINRNHFASWMLLALPIGMGLLFATTYRSGPTTRVTLRERMLWIGSSAGTPVLLIAAATLVMAGSLLWTMSRSGIAAASVAMAVMAAAALWRSPGTRQRWAVAGSVTTAVVAVVGWRGADTLFAWYGRTATLEWRVQLWKDTWPALQDFWITGSGLNTYTTLLLAYPRTDLSTHARAAHNDYLQLVLEGGLLVCVPVVILIAALVREIVRGLRAPQDETSWWIRMGAVAGICGMAVQEISEFSLQVPGVALLFATCVALAIHEPAPVHTRHSHTHPRPPRAAERANAF